MKNNQVATGLLLVTTYAVLGFDGLGHYAIAPMAHHTLGGEYNYSFGSGCGGVIAAWGCVLAIEPFPNEIVDAIHIESNRPLIF